MGWAVSDSRDLLAERWLGNFVAKIRGRLKPESPELVVGLMNALAGTPFPAIYAQTVRRARNADRTQLSGEAGRAFAVAREAREDGRPRLCIAHLSFALAGYLVAGEEQDAATSLGNIGMQLARWATSTRPTPHSAQQPC
jgi:hypothetical protein